MKVTSTVNRTIGAERQVLKNCKKGEETGRDKYQRARKRPDIHVDSDMVDRAIKDMKARKAAGLLRIIV